MKSISIKWLCQSGSPCLCVLPAIATAAVAAVTDKKEKKRGEDSMILKHPTVIVEPEACASAEQINMSHYDNTV